MKRQCAYCGLTFEAKRKRKVYCDMLCQERAKSERQATKPQRKEWLRKYFQRTYWGTA